MNCGTISEDLLRKKLRDSRMRLTPQRLGIFNAIRGSKEHPSAEAVFRKMRKAFPNISFDTVNRTLLSFAGMNVLKVVEGRGNPKRFDPNTAPHHHLHCVQCNRIFDIEEPSFNRLEIPESISSRHQITQTRVVMTGICEDCLKKFNQRGVREGGGAD